MAQHKGYAIALMMDMLSGVLTGSGFGAEVAGPYQAERRSRAGQLMIALNIESMQPLTEFNARMEALIAQIKAVPLAQGFSEVFYPGEIEARNDHKTPISLLPPLRLGGIRKGPPYVFGIDNVDITFSGESTPTTASCIGTAIQAPGTSLQATLIRMVD